jgi:maltose alpha-D-glucosyltransferase/alpha-amylase
MDAAPFIIEETTPDNPNPRKDLEFLTELRQHLEWRKGDSVLLAEANVEPDQLKVYFGDNGGSSNRIHMLFDFMLNGRMILALARHDAEPVIDALRDTPMLPDGGQWATFLRNHDEIDLSRLTADQRDLVFSEFGPDEDMQLYGRGIRRRLAPMLGGDRRRIELAYSLQFTLRGTPVIRYGEEIGMGDDLSLHGRDAIRTPMQWNLTKNAGFSRAEAKDLVRPVVSEGEFAYEKVNVTTQRRDPRSLLSWFERMIRTLREAPEVGSGTCTHVDVPVAPGVLVHRADGDTGTMVFVHNLTEQDATLDLSTLAAEASMPNDVLADREYAEVGDFAKVEVGGYGYRWIRLRRFP